MLELLGDVAEHVATDGVLVAVRAEEPDDAFGLLERLEQAVEQHAIEAPIAETDVILVMLVEGVHAVLQGGERS